MKRIFILIFTLVAFNAYAEPRKEVSGIVTLDKGLDKKMTPGGTLYIFAKAAGTAAGNGAPPVAVLRIPGPKFPVKFTLTTQNTMIPGGPFEGPFSVYARY